MSYPALIADPIDRLKHSGNQHPIRFVTSGTLVLLQGAVMEVGQRISQRRIRAEKTMLDDPPRGLYKMSRVQLAGLPLSMHKVRLDLAERAQQRVDEFGG